MQSSEAPKDTSGATLAGVLRRLASSPFELLVHRWNWKASLLSALIRASIYLVTNLSAGWTAAAAAMSAEFLFRIATTGFYASFIQAFRGVAPAWRANLFILAVMPVLALAVEYMYHSALGTPNFRVSFRYSAGFTALSALFNLFVMRRGAMVIGPDQRSLAKDLRSMPRIIVEFLMAVPRAIASLWRMTSR